MQPSWSGTHWISNSNESKRTVQELNAWLCSSANPLKQYLLVYKMIYKQQEQHHRYQISSTNEHTAERQLLQLGSTWTKGPGHSTDSKEERKSCKMKQMKQGSSSPTSLTLPLVNTALQAIASTGWMQFMQLPMGEARGVFCTDSDFTMNTICSQPRPSVAQFKIPYAVPAGNEILKIMR